MRGVLLTTRVTSEQESEPGSGSYQVVSMKLLSLGLMCLDIACWIPWSSSFTSACAVRVRRR